MQPKTVILMCLMCFISFSSWAKTPDGKPPANEGVCDEARDQNPDMTPGLYGICIAYCEARDFDIQTDDGLEVNLTAAEKLLHRYEKMKNEDDPDMPCLPDSVCPAFSQEQLNLIGSNGWTVTENNGTRNTAGYDALFDYEVGFPTPTTSGGRVIAQTRRYFGDSREDKSDDILLGYFNYELTFFDAPQQIVTRISKRLTEEEFTACNNAILNYDF